jgi:hypothetical protein
MAAMPELISRLYFIKIEDATEKFKKRQWFLS